MKIIDLLSERTIKLNLKSENKENVIKELVELINKSNRLIDKNKVLDAVFEREEKFSTGIGMGVAIPHAKSSSVKKPTIAFGKSKSGIDFESSDDEPAYLFFLIAVPENSSDEHLKILSKLSRRLMHKELRNSLKSAKTSAEIIEILDK
ncbi:MAG: PTS sugar transporter subunit IIA [Bacillota bacterium]